MKPAQQCGRGSGDHKQGWRLLREHSQNALSAWRTDASLLLGDGDARRGDSASEQNPAESKTRDRGCKSRESGCPLAAGRAP